MFNDNGSFIVALFEFFLFFAWFMCLFWIFGDIFRSKDLSGWSKALWTIFIIVLPFLGVLVYLIVRGNSMQERALQDAANNEAQFRGYVQQVAATSGSGGTADELAKMADLHDNGVITEEEFQKAKAKALA